MVPKINLLLDILLFFYHSLNLLTEWPTLILDEVCSILQKAMFYSFSTCTHTLLYLMVPVLHTELSQRE
jgi:hypothetical protein